MPKLRRPPAPPRLPLFWNMYKTRRDPSRLFVQLFRQYGDIVWLPALFGDFYLVSNPAYIKHFLLDNALDNYPKNFLSGQRGIVLGAGLSSSDGAYWKRHRRMIQPAFQRERLLATVPRMVAVTERVLERHWEPRARSGEPMEVFPEMSRITLSILGQLVFSEDTPDDVSEAVFIFMMYSISPSLLGTVRNLLPSPLFRRLRNLVIPKLEPSAYRIDGFSWEKVRERLQQPGQREDMLDLLIRARDDKGEPMSELEVRDEFVELFYGGQVSTGIGLSWMWYCLGSHPEVAERMYEGVERTLGVRSPTVEDLPGLQYVSQIFDETLRLYPPAQGVSRPAVKADKLGDYDVPVGTMLLTANHIMHQHPDYWEAPEVFNPDRFAPEQAQKRPRFVYLPFGAGQRVCIGAFLASLIATLVSALVAQRYRLTLVPGKVVLPSIGGACYPTNLWMKVTPLREPSRMKHAAVG